MRQIDADALIAKCGNWYVEEGTEEGFISNLKHLIDLQPTIEPERKTARWVPKNDGRYHCSSCDGIAPKGYRWDYCPICGVDMRGEQDG